ncbi:MAG: hypothetical protein ABR946_09330 [Solirubrobacteraceae bacterium]|jgi:hypothetical protein
MSMITLPSLTAGPARRPQATLTAGFGPATIARLRGELDEDDEVPFGADDDDDLSELDDVDELEVDEDDDELDDDEFEAEADV